MKDHLTQELANIIVKSFKMRSEQGGYADQMTPDQEPQIVRSIVSGLRREAGVQLGEIAPPVPRPLVRGA
jgi:hypothetical protein